MTDVPIIFSAPMVVALLDGRKTMTRRLAWREARTKTVDGAVTLVRAPSPWQKIRPGDRLWVKERLCSHGHFGFPLSFVPQIREGDGARIWSYFADGIPDPTNSRPSIHCPRAFSRLTLVVTATKIERLTDISEQDCFAEGIEGQCLDEDTGEVTKFGPVALMNFGRLWESLHGPGSWLDNPEVVALSFRVIKQNIDSAKEAA